MKTKYKVYTWCNYIDYDNDCDDIKTTPLATVFNLKDAIIIANEYVESNFSNPLPYRITEESYMNDLKRDGYASVMNDVRTEGERVFIEPIYVSEL